MVNKVLQGICYIIHLLFHKTHFTNICFMSLCNSNRVLIIQASYHVTTRTLDQREAKRAHFYNSIHNHSKKRSYINLCMEMMCLWKKRPWYSILISNRNQKTMGNCISSIRNKMVIKSIQHRFVETKTCSNKKRTLYLHHFVLYPYCYSALYK